MSNQTNTAEPQSKRSLVIVLDGCDRKVADAVETLFEHAFHHMVEEFPGFTMELDQLDSEWLLAAWDAQGPKPDEVSATRYRAGRAAFGEQAGCDLAQSSPMEDMPQGSITVSGDAWMLQQLETLALGRGLSVTSQL
ncbi:MAG: hypothetical protein AB7N24_17340 [Dehalococcoidia bacterium]